MNARDIERQINGLGTALIAACTGVALPVAMIPAFAPFVRLALEKHAETKQLKAVVTDGIAQWAAGEGLTEHLGTGIEIATAAIAGHRMDRDALRRLSYDADLITESIIERERPGEVAWGLREGDELDDEHAVARRAIRAAVATLVEQQHLLEGEIIPLLARGLAEQSEQYARQAETNAEVLRLLRDFKSSADRVDLETYLAQRLEAWDAGSGILPREGGIRHPSQIERDLTMTGAENRATTMTVDDALRQNPHLVVLGPPGAGKSWLARRIARDAAQSALAALRAGAGTDEVEVPLLTTWETWRRQPTTGGARSRVIAASLATPGNGDLGSVELEERIRRLLEEHHRVLAVVDSLDEAETYGNVDGLLRDLESIVGWRTVLTSRQSAWSSKSSTRLRTDGVANLQPLTWDKGIVPFIDSWFSADPGRARSLIGHLEADPRLRDSAGVPLLLSFYCLYAEGRPVDSPLPQTSHELHDAVIDSLLVGDWSSVERPEDGGPEEAKRILTDWAWEAVEDAVDPAGLGSWGESFPSPSTSSLTPEIVRALDNVAPRRIDPRGASTRTFRHRTLLEHLVAQHIAGISPETAAESLLPHLWFDPDWEVVVPRAFALHPQRDDVVTRLRELTHSASTSLLSREAGEQLDSLWLDVLAESRPTDWSAAHRGTFHELRVSRVLRDSTRVARSAHWRDSNPAAVSALVAALGNAELAQVERFARAIARLTSTHRERREAVHAILERLSLTSRADEVSRLVDALMGLGPTEEDREDAARRSLLSPGDDESTGWGTLAGALAALDLPLAERRAALEQVLGAARGRTGTFPAGVHAQDSSDDVVRDLSAALLRVTGREADRLVGALAALGLTDDERFDAARTLREVASRTSEPARLYRTVDAFLRLDPPEDEQRACAEVLRAVIPDAATPVAERLVSALVRVDRSERSSRVVVEKILGLLPRTGEKTIAGLVGALVAVDAAEVHRRAAAQSILARLASTAPRAGKRLVEALLRLEPTEQERRETARRLLSTAASAGVKSADTLLSALVMIGPTEGEREQARAMILRGLPLTSDPELIDHLVVTLLRLEPTTEDRDAAVKTLLAALGTAAPSAVGRLVAALGRLETTEEVRRVAAGRILEVLSAASPKGAARLAAALLGLGPTAEERLGAARELLIPLDRTTSPWDAKRPARMLRQFSTTQQWQAMILRRDER